MPSVRCTGTPIFGEDDINVQRALRGRAQDSGTSPRRGRADAGEESAKPKRRQPSEGDARAETPLSLLIWSVRRRDVAEGCAVHISIGEVEIRMIQCVQRLRAELELDSLRQGECSIDRHIHLEETWSAKVVPSTAPEPRAILQGPGTIRRAGRSEYGWATQHCIGKPWAAG